MLSLPADELVHRSVPDRQNTNHFAWFVDFVNGAVHIPFRAIEQMPQPAFGLFALGSYGAAARKPFEGIGSLLKSVEPAGGTGRIVCRDPLIQVVEVSLGAERQLNAVHHAAHATR